MFTEILVFIIFLIIAFKLFLWRNGYVQKQKNKPLFDPENNLILIEDPNISNSGFIALQGIKRAKEAQNVLERLSQQE